MGIVRGPAGAEFLAEMRGLGPVRPGLGIGQIGAHDVKRLRGGQLAWLKSRNTSCSQRKGTSTLIDPRCMAEVTTARTQWLQERIGECRGAAGCLNDRL